MKKKMWIPVIAVIALLVILFIPIPRGSLDDGGTRDYIALTYRIVDWNRIYADGVYEKAQIYFGADRNKTIDELWQQEYANVEESFIATILEISGNSVLVEPVEGEPERLSSDKISFGIADLEKIEVVVGSVIKVAYKGGIMESYPAKINATGWAISNNLRHMEYTEQWLDKETAEKCEYDMFDHIVITKIYSNCFFARTVVPLPWEIKLNGSLSDDWCVGDQVICTYENTYRGQDDSRIEADFLTVEASTWEMEPGKAYKPVIYLYPEEQTEISVKLNLDGKLICTYPAYNSGWCVTAMPDGTLTDSNGQTYSYLYWEGETNARWDTTEGFCIKGEDTAAFLEDALARLGLTRREANEFIVYWLPLMEQNPYNIISFQTDVYTNAAKLEIEPAPDTLLRVFMTWKASDCFAELPEQRLIAPNRDGFTVVEWGGTEIKNYS